MKKILKCFLFVTIQLQTECLTGCQDLCFKINNKKVKNQLKCIYFGIMYILVLRIQSLEVNAELNKEDLC